MKAFLSISLFALSLLAGCGAPMQTHPDPAHDMATPGISDPPPPTPDKDGSRIRQLKRRTTTADGYQGTEPTYSLYDKQFDSECTVMTDSAGQQRCFPSPFLQVFGFADDKCTIAAGYLIPSCLPSVPKYMISYINDSCASQLLKYRAWKTGPQVSTYYTNSASGCNPTPVPAGYIILSASDEIPASALAAITYRVY